MIRAPRFTSALLCASAAWFLACDGGNQATAPDRPPIEVAASGSGGPSITATNPAYGHRGDAGLAVTITGTGFKPGAQASWKLDGNPTADVVVLSTTYVSSTQLSATINITSTATVAYYDVTVTQTGRKGIGTESATNPDIFEVTQAVPIAGSVDMRGVNDNGEIAGQNGPVYWSQSSGLLQVDSGQRAGFAISPLGNAIAANGLPRLYTRAGAVGTPWQLTLLPIDAAATDGGAHALLADAATGQVVLLAGQVKVSASKRTTLIQPRAWTWQGATSSWQMIALSTGSSGQGSVRQLSRNGTVVGALGLVNGPGRVSGTSQAAVWQPDGSGGWLLVTLAPVPSAAEGINSAGTLIVGAAGGTAAYWQVVGGVWSGPVSLPGGCTNARAVDDLQRIAVDGCNPGGNSSAAPAGVLVPPYSTTTMVRLGGLGKQQIGMIESMSPSGAWVVGAGGGVGVYWRPF